MWWKGMDGWMTRCEGVAVLRIRARPLGRGAYRLNHGLLRREVSATDYVHNYIGVEVTGAAESASSRHAPANTCCKFTYEYFRSWTGDQIWLTEIFVFSNMGDKDDYSGEEERRDGGVKGDGALASLI